MTNEYDYTDKRPWYQEHIKKMLPYVARLLKEKNICFWLDWGTLLGAVRNGKMIPWDFDIDLGIFHQDAERLLSCKDRVAKDGFEFYVDKNAKHARKIRFFTRNVKKHESLFPAYPNGFEFHIDIDPWITNGDVAKATFDLSKTRTVKELLNLEEIEFEGATYPCPAEPEKSLNQLIGGDWRTLKVSGGNAIFIRQYDPENTDILEEIKKHASCS